MCAVNVAVLVPDGRMVLVCEQNGAMPVDVVRTVRVVEPHVHLRQVPVDVGGAGPVDVVGREPQLGRELREEVVLELIGDAVAVAVGRIGDGERRRLELAERLPAGAVMTRCAIIGLVGRGTRRETHRDQDQVALHGGRVTARRVPSSSPQIPARAPPSHRT